MDWFDDEAFWSTFDAYIFPPERMKSADQEVEQVIALAGVSRGDALDLCCGPGRHAVSLARQGFHVTGVDRSATLLARARAHAAERQVDVELVRHDMRSFVRPASYDLAVNLFTSFGYFDDEADQVRVLQNVFDSLRPGGTFVIDVIGKEVLARVYQPTVSAYAADGTLVVMRGTVIDGWTRVRSEWTAVKDETSRTFTFEHWIYSGRELSALLAAAGFVEVRLCGDFSGREYDTTATRLVAVARKAARSDR